MKPAHPETPSRTGPGHPHDRRRRRLTSAVAAFVSLLLGIATLIGGAPARAEARAPVITTAEFRSSEDGPALTSAAPGTAGGLYITYDLDNSGYRSGDTLTYTLPRNFVPAAPDNTVFTFVAVYHGVPHQIGTATYRDGVVRAILSAGVEELDGIRGHFWIGGAYWGTPDRPDLTLNAGTDSAYTIRITHVGGSSDPGDGAGHEHGKYAMFKEGSNNAVIQYSVALNLDGSRPYPAGSVLTDRASGLLLNPATFAVETFHPARTLTRDVDYAVVFDEDHHGLTITLLTDVSKELWFSYESTVFEVADIYRNDVTTTLAGDPDSIDRFGHDMRWTEISGSSEGYLRDLTLVKKDLDTRRPLAAAVFDLYRTIDGFDRLVRAGLTTGDDGKVVATDLLSGMYTFVEVTAPPGYTLVGGSDRISVTLEPRQTANQEVEFFNQREPDPVRPGAVELKKVDDTDAPLEGAEFTISDGTGTVLASQTTDAQGVARFSELPPGDYTVTETRASTGFEISAEAAAGYRVAVVPGDTARVVGSGLHGAIVNLPTPDPVVPTLWTSATNKATGGKLVPAAGGTVTDRVVYTDLSPGATFTLRGELMDKATRRPTGITASKTFVPQTADGEVTLEFTVGSGHADARLVAFERIYAASDDREPLAVHEDFDSDEQTVTVDSSPALRTTATNAVDGGKRMDYVGGTIADSVSYTGLTAGEQYTLVGWLTESSTGRMVPGSTARVTFIPSAATGVQVLELTLPAGCAGADIVVYEQLSEDARASVVAEHTELGDAGQTVAVDADPTIATTATNREDGTHTLPFDGGVITDEIRYTGLVPGLPYTIRGELMDKATGRSTGVRSADRQFTPTASAGTVSVEFAVDASHAGRSLVAYEWLYRGSSLEAQHTDIDSVAQTVVVEETPTVATTATNGDTGDKTPLRFDGGAVLDEVRYTGLTPGRSYAISGELMTKHLDETTGGAFAVGTGITSEITFEADTADGSVSLRFEVDGSHSGELLVAFEKLFDAGGALLARHESIESTEQTVTVGAVPTLATTATNADDAEEPLEFQGGTITDLVEYTGLVPGVEHTLEGELFDKATGEPTGITAQRMFVPDAPDGSIALDFTVPSGYGGTRLVVFETLSADGRVIATHRDIDSEEQTVDVRPDPAVSTSAADRLDGDKQLAEHGGTIVDTVYYTGLIPGREYVLEGELMRKAEGTSTGLSASRTFVPESADGAVDLELTVPAGHRDTWLVVFETVLDGGLVVAEHTDIDSEAQSVFVDHTPPAGIANTGSSLLMPLGWAASILVAFGAALIATTRMRNRRARTGSAGTLTP